MAQRGEIHLAFALSIMLCIAIQNLSIGVNVVSKGSPSRMRKVRRISLGMTILPKSSTRLTIPVAFIYLSPFLVGRPSPLGRVPAEQADGRGFASSDLACARSQFLWSDCHQQSIIRFALLPQRGRLFAPTIILQITMLLFVKERRLYRHKQKMNLHFLERNVGSSFLKFFTGDEIIDGNIIVF